MAGVVLSTIMFNAAYAHTISGSEQTGERRARRRSAVGLPFGRVLFTRPAPAESEGKLSSAAKTAIAARMTPVRSAEVLSSSRPSPSGTMHHVEVGEAGVRKAAQPLLHGGLAAADRGRRRCFCTSPCSISFT